MNRAKWLIMLALISVAGASGQTISSVMVGTNPTGAIFQVDGQFYNQTQTFLWPAGSKHDLNFPYSFDNLGQSLGYQASTDGKYRYTFSGWTPTGTFSGLNGPFDVTFTADPSISTVIASLTEQFQVQVNMPSFGAATCAAAPGNPTQNGSPEGIVYVGNTCYATTSASFTASGPTPLSAFPYPGWVFYGWLINNGMQTSPLSTWNLVGPTTFQPLFSIAKRVHFMTNPPGLTVLVDRTVSSTPLTPSADQSTCTFNGANQIGPNPPYGFPALCTGDFDLLPGSPHSVGANTPQMDVHNNYWVFEGFTNGLTQNSTFVPDSSTQASTTLTASFVPGVKVSLISSQPGLAFSVDGRSNWPAFTFVWGQGETHTISAPSTQVDANGRTWTFVKWSNGGTQTQTLTVPTTTTTLGLTATFAELPQVTVNSVPQGIQLTVAGSPCVTPCVLSQATGSTVQISAPTSITSSAVSRISFNGWSDGTTTATRTVTLNQNTQAYQVNYQTQWAIAATSVPAGTAGFTYNPPPTSDGFFADGTQVTVTVAAANGYKFLKWGGDVSGTYNVGYLTMSGPHAITAYTVAVPFIAPAGIMSAAGATPDGTMAPGSVISIYGNNLAPALQLGTTNPLPQSLGNITVTIGNYILPLLFVSPGQINAQLPVELVDGNYTLLVHQTGQSDVSGTLNVSRDAPAMFTQTNPENLPLVLALHQDGTLISFDSPAIHGETISIYGTGFGPYTTTTVDGFFVPATPTNTVSDPVTLSVGSVTKTPDFAGAAPGAVGLTLIKMKITDDLPASTTVNVQIQVNTKPSATVVLPLQ